MRVYTEQQRLEMQNLEKQNGQQPTLERLE